MIAEYKGLSYYFDEINDKIALVSNKMQKKTEGFTSIDDYYWKEVSLYDEDLKSIFKIHFWVKYCDCIENDEIWLADRGRPIGIRVPDIHNGELIIEVSHNAKDESWYTYENGVAAKIINISDCLEYMIEKIYYKKDGKMVDGEKEWLSVSAREFKELMINCDYNLI